MTKLQELASNYPEYWWWVKNPSSLSDEAIVEWILNYGEFSEKKELIAILWSEKFEYVFESIRSKPRSNLRKETWIYWRLYIDKHFHHA
jgi:hypothetical protein